MTGITDRPDYESNLSSGFFLSGISYLVFTILYFASRLFLVRVLSVESYGLVTYVWATGGTIGFLLMMGREQEALVEIPNMSYGKTHREWKYVLKAFIGASLSILLLLGILRVVNVIDDMMWGVLGIGITNLFFQIASYTILSQKYYGKHVLLNLTMFGGSFAAIILLFLLNSLDASTTITSLIAFQWISFLMAYFIVQKQSPDSNEPLDSEQIEVWSFRRFSKETRHYFFVDIVATIAPVTGLLLLERITGLESVAYLTFAFLIYRITRVFSWIIFVVYSPIQAESYNADFERYVEAFHDSLGLGLLFAGILSIGVAGIASPLIELLAGFGYIPSIPMLLILLAGGMFDSIYQVCSSVLRTSYKSKSLLYVNSGVLAVNIVTTVYLVSIFSALGAAIAFSLTLAAQGLLSSFYINRNKSTYPTTMRVSEILSKSTAWSFIAIIIVVLRLLCPDTDSILFIGLSISLFIIVGRGLRLFKFKLILDIVSLIRKSIR